MATRTVITCDLCGKDAVATVPLGPLVVDLCASHRAQYDRALKPFTDAAHKPGAASAPRSSTPPKPARQPGEHARARAWAKANGVPVTDRGRVAPDVMKKYVDATREGR